MKTKIMQIAAASALGAILAGIMIAIHILKIFDMTKKTIEVDVPNGYEISNIEYFLDSQYIKVRIKEKIQPRRIVIEETEEERSVSYRDWFEDNEGTIGQWNDNQYGSQESYKIWREVKETSIPFTKEETKLSLSFCECNGLFRGNQTAINKVKEFIKENS